jgi:hypothetical protein
MRIFTALLVHEPLSGVKFPQALLPWKDYRGEMKKKNIRKTELR